MSEKFNPKISGPNQGILHQKGLDLPTVAGFIRSNIPPFLELDWVLVGDADSEGSEHGAEELKIGQHNGIDEDIIAQLDDEKFVLRGTGVEHIAILVLHQHRRRALTLGVCLEGRRSAIIRGIVRPLFACSPSIFWSFAGPGALFRSYPVTGNTLRRKFLVLNLPAPQRWGFLHWSMVDETTKVDINLGILAE